MKQKITRGLHRKQVRGLESAVERHLKARALSNSLSPRRNKGVSLDSTQTVRRIGGPAAAHSAPVIRSVSSKSLGQQAVPGARPVIGAKRVLSVLMPAYKTKPYIDEAIESVLGQGLPWGVRLELIIGIDADDELLGHVLSKWSRDGIVIFMNKKNEGPYKTLNSAFMLSTGDYIAIMDSDDIILPSHYTKPISIMERDSTIDMVGGWTQWMNSEGVRRPKVRMDPVDPMPGFRGSERMSYPLHSTRTMRRSLYHRLGGYRPWPCAADHEFLDRALASMAKVRVLQEVTLLYRMHESQLTARKPKGNSDRERCERLRYQGLETLRSGRQGAEVSVEMVGSETVVRHDGRSSVVSGRIGAVLPTIPSRESTAKKVVASIAPQVDSMVVHLNGYASVPSWAVRDNVRAVLHPAGTGPLVRYKDFPLAEVVLTCDDDIQYPSDYAKEMVSQLRALGPGKALSCHGSLLPASSNSYLERERVTSFRSPMTENVKMDLLGSGVSAFWGEDLLHSGSNSAIDAFAMEDDVWISFAMKRIGVGIISAKKKAGWFGPEVNSRDGGLWQIAVRDGFKSRMKAIRYALQLGLVT